MTGRVVVALGLVMALSASAQTKSIKLRNETITTSPRGLRAAGKGPAPARIGTGLHLIQVEGQLQPEQRRQLREMGVDLLRYVPDDAFVARFNGATVDAVEALEFVRWVGGYRPELKLHRKVRERAIGPVVGEDLALNIVIASEARPDELAEVRRHLRTVQSESRTRFGGVLRGRVPPGQLQKLAESPVVLWVEPAPNFKLIDEEASKIVAGDGGPGQLATQSLGYDGRGVTVAVADSGLDSGEIDFMHPDLAGRVTALFYYGDLEDASDEHSHGTHVAGIVGGNGATGETDENGVLYGLGVAPGVNIIAQRLFDAAGGYQPPPTFETMTRDAKRAGADIGSNSWGDDTQGRYDVSAMEFDALVRDADALALGDQPYILEFSAGNAGPGAQTIGSPAVAKNVIATGASQNNRFNLPIEEFPIYDTGQETMADFSSRGPCEDGRIKPDVTAPGSWIASLRSIYANDDFAWWPISENYMYQGGTSQAGPHVSGAAAVFVQYWRESHSNVTPSPAMVKAALINSATDMDDTIETDPVPNNDEGWGRVDLTEIIGSPRDHEFVDQSVLLGTGQVSEHRVLVDDPEEPLKITLVYTDVPGFPGAVPALVNDLDLEVLAPDGTVYRGNQFEFGESIPNAASGDRINNVEAVHLFLPVPGEYVIRVRARNVSEDARIDTGAVDQDFALVVSGSLAPLGTGILAFDRRAYTAPSVIRMTLFDHSLGAQPTATVSLRSTLDSVGETITLRSTGVSGVFTASVATATGPAIAGNGRLEIAHGNLIEAIYQDAAPPATRRYTAEADLLPPVIANVSSSFAFGRMTIRWITDEDASGIIRYGTNTLTLAATNTFPDTIQEVSLVNLIPNVTYRYAVSAEDAAGNRSTNNNNGAFFTFVATPTPTVLIVDDYNNDFFTVPPLSGYTTPLNQLGVSYEVWTTEFDGPVPVNLLPAYRCVIWRPAEFRLGTTFSSGDVQAMTSYLAGGGSLLISSMEFLSRLQADGFPNFGRDVLQVQSFVEDLGAPSITGASGDPIGSGINVALNYVEYEDELKELVGVPTDASDTINGTTNAAPILLNGSAVVGLRSPKAGVDLPGRVVVLTFPLDAVPMGSGVGNNRPGLLRNILNFLAPQEGNGTIALDREVYSAPNIATIEVEDLDLVGQSSASATCFSPLQPGGVPVTLAPTARRGLFRGTITLVTNAPVTGELQVRSGDTFRAQYLDASLGAAISASATVENTPPETSDVDYEVGYVDALIYWVTSEETDALVQYSESPGTFPINYTAYDPNFSFYHELPLEQLKPSTLYYFRVVSRDRAGNVTIDDNHGTNYTFTTLTPQGTPWSDEFEEGTGDWVVISAEESELEWTLGVPNNGATAVSPVNAWGTSLDGGTYDLAETILLSPAVFVSGGDKVYLRFSQNYDFAPFLEEDDIEFGEVRLYTNLNVTPVTLATITGTSDDWEEVEIDLTPFHGQVVHIDFHYFLFGVEFAPRFGWLLDDISITASNIVPGTIRITNNLWQARYVMSGPRSRSGAGLGQVITNAQPGPYRISFGDVPYYTTPAPQTNELAPLGTVMFQGNYTMADANNNGMADAWEVEQFGSVSPTRTRFTDTDGDGFTDFAEFNAGTNPTQPTSTLRLLPPVRVANELARLEWPSVPGRAYLVEGTADGVHWSPASGWILASGTLTTFSPSGGPGAPYLFRIQVRP